MKTPFTILAASALPILSGLGEPSIGSNDATNLDPHIVANWNHLSDEPVVKIDIDPRSQGNGGVYPKYVTHKQLESIKRSYDPKSFDKWVEKLKAIHPGMTITEVKSTLSVRDMPTVLTTGAGLSITFELDDFYCVQGLFDGEHKLRYDLTKPIAFAYFTALLTNKPPDEPEVIKILGLPKEHTKSEAETKSANDK